MREDDERVGFLVDYIKYTMPYLSEGGMQVYEELLQRATRSGNLYAQALAHINYARVYQDMQQNTQYTQCAQSAYEIAAREEYRDILIRYYNLEGIRYMLNYDEANALSMYLKGIHLAVETTDHLLCAVLYNNVAEIFYGHFEYEKAILYYQKALGTLELVDDGDVRRYREAFLENLISCYYYTHDLPNAKKYLQACRSNACDDHIRPFAREEVELKVLLLEEKKEEALEGAVALFHEAKASGLEDTILFYAYSFLCDVFLEFEKQEEARFCLSRLERMKMEVSQNYAMETQKRKIRYDEIFGVTDTAAFREFYELTLRFERSNTTAISNSLSAAVLLYEKEKERRRIEKERRDLEESILYDPLTGIYTRRACDQIVAEALRNEDVAGIAYVMIDIDYFKEYNDYYGHHRGDAALKTVSALIQQALPEQSYAARYGGDEFACLLLNQSIREVDLFMRKIRDDMAKKEIVHAKAGSGKRLTLSQGAYYTVKHSGTSLDALIQRADDALYQVKNHGRNGYRIFRDGDAPVEQF